MTAARDLLARLSPEKRALLALRLQKKGGEASAVAGEHPAVIPDPASRYEPFPLTDTQQAYWIGRSGVFELGSVAAHSYLEIEGRNLDLERLNCAWQLLIARHGMLRAVLLPDGRQRVLEEVPPYRIEVLDLRGREPQAAASELEAVRGRMSHQVLPSERWPLFELRATRLDDQRVRLHVSLDALALDGWSMFLLFDEWCELYRDPKKALPRLELEFRDYVLAEIALRESESYRASLDYWRGRLAELPGPPDLPLAKSPSSVTDPRIVRRTSRLEPKDWALLKARAAQAGLTPASVLVAAYAEVVSLWSTNPRFTLNVPRFNRLPLHPQVNEILGEFASFTLLEVDTSGEDRFEERARRLQERQWEDLDHGDVSGVRIARELAQLRGSSSGGVMPVVFTNAPLNSQARDVSLLSATRALGDVVFSINQTPQVWLDNHVSERGGALVCEWDTVEDLFPEGLSQDMFEAYGRLLERLAREEDPWQWRGPEIARQLIPPNQVQQRTAVNATDASMPERLLQDLFLAQANRQPNAKAVIAPERSLTYAELDRLSNLWGRYLTRLGAVPNSLVAVVMEKGWEQVVGALGIIRSGAAYLPIDPSLPAERLAYLLENGEVRLVLTQSWLDGKLAWPGHLRRFAVDAEEPECADTGGEARQAPDDLAYVIYTSGSTGLPKGVMIAHRGVVNSIVCTNERFRVNSEDRVLGLTALHHDMSVYDIFGVLAAGGILVLPASTGARDPEHWSELMRAHGVTIWNSVPAMMEMLLEYAAGRPGVLPPTLRLAFLGGDWIPVTVPDRLGAVAPGARVVSVGGPTETTLWNIWYPVERSDPAWKSIPYGRPIANTRYHVFSDALENRPDWVTGELHCGGVGLAKGYWRDEERTRDKFFLHPRTGERLYRTGDLGRFRPDGNLEFVGRADSQVKIAGQRIELGEIETALRQHPGVQSAVVSAPGAAQGKKRLVAYIVASRAPAPSAAELRGFLAVKLAEHMIPGSFVTLDRLPLTRNGKVDRSALPDPAEAPAQPVSAPKAPTTQVLGKIARVIEDVLGVAQVEPEANLMSLGANSIDMIRIGNSLEKEFGFRPRMDQLFRLQTASALAGYFEQNPALNQTLPASGGQGAEREVRTLVASYRVLLDPDERERFKNQQPGVRRDLGRPSIPLAPEERDEPFIRKYSERRSYRSFSLKPIASEAFGKFLSCLSQITLDGKRKYRYASPGGLYPGQVYLHVKPGRVQGVPAGTYYYHPLDHRLVGLTANVDLDRSIHIPFINTPIFDEAAFSIFLIVQLSAIAPGYGEKSLHFATLEAGIIAHLLESCAPEFQIGLCQIGSLDFDRIRHLFLLEESHVLIHSLLGGRVDAGHEGEGPGRALEADAARAAKLQERIAQLTPEEVRALLEENRKAGRE